MGWPWSPSSTALPGEKQPPQGNGVGGLFFHPQKSRAPGQKVPSWLPPAPPELGVLGGWCWGPCVAMARGGLSPASPFLPPSPGGVDGWWGGTELSWRWAWHIPVTLGTAGVCGLVSWGGDLKLHPPWCGHRSLAVTPCRWHVPTAASPHPAAAARAGADPGQPFRDGFPDPLCYGSFAAAVASAGRFAAP